MRKQVLIVSLAIFTASLACQALSRAPKRNGTVISNCADLVSAVGNAQPGDIPKHLTETGIKRGDEFDANEYFKVLPHLSMREGYTLDYVYQVDGLGSFPRLYARPADQAPYASTEDVPGDAPLPDFREYLDVEDLEQGYFEYVVMHIMAAQFYLVWHANYNDTQIACNRQAVDAIIASINADDFGNEFDLGQQAKARAMKNIEPAVNLTGDIATVEIVTFTKWGGFYRLTFTISRETPHKIIDVKQEELVPYDCGIMF